MLHYHFAVNKKILHTTGDARGKCFMKQLITVAFEKSRRFEKTMICTKLNTEKYVIALIFEISRTICIILMHFIKKLHNRFDT